MISYICGVLINVLLYINKLCVLLWYVVKQVWWQIGDICIDMNLYQLSMQKTRFPSKSVWHDGHNDIFEHIN